MTLLKTDNLECPECSNEKFISQEILVFHKSVRPRIYPGDKQNPLTPIKKHILYKCSKCGFEMDI
jgi:uncharacterized Zn finger protein